MDGDPKNGKNYQFTQAHMKCWMTVKSHILKNVIVLNKSKLVNCIILLISNSATDTGL